MGSGRFWLRGLLVFLALVLLVGVVILTRLEPPVSTPPTTPPAPAVEPTPAVPPAPDARTQILSDEPAALPSGHPRMFFSEADIPGLRERARSTHEAIWRPIIQFASQRRDESPPEMPRGGDLDGFRNAGNQIIALAFAHVITGEQAYLDATRRSLLAYADWEHWGDESGDGDRDLGFHHMLLGNSLAYDWVYSGLSPSERSTIGNNLARRAQESYEASFAREYEWNNWWRKAYIQNHHWINHSALGVAALVLAEEDGRSEGWLSQAIDHMSRVSNMLAGIGDGSWHEGIPYQSYGLSLSLPFYHNLKRLQGRDLLPDSYLDGYAYWWLYNSLPDSGRFLLSYSDMEWDWNNPYGPQGVLRFVASEYQNGHAEWVAQHIIESTGRHPNVYTVPWYVLEFLYYDPSVEPEPPDGLAVNRVFADLEGVIWRTGWGPGDLAFGLKASAPGGRFAYNRFVAQQPPFDPSTTVDIFTSGHEHEDSGTFYLYRGADELTAEHTGNGVRDAGSHNTLLVDGEGQYNPRDAQDPRFLADVDARLEAVGWTDSFNFAVANLTDRYKTTNSQGLPDGNRLEEFRRYVLFSKPDYLLVVDTIRSNSEHDYDWVIHFPAGASIEDDWLRGVGTNGSLLGVKVLEPGGFSATSGDDGKPYVRIRPESRTDDVTFVTLLYPTSSGEWDQKPAVSLLGSDDAASVVRVELNGTQDHILRYGGGDSIDVDEYSTDARAASVLKDEGGQLTRLFLAQGSRLSGGNGSRVLVEAGSAISTLEVSYRGTSLSVFGTGVRGARVYAPGVDPDRVTLNGAPVTSSRSGDYLVIGGD